MEDPMHDDPTSRPATPDQNTTPPGEADRKATQAAPNAANAANTADATGADAAPDADAADAADRVCGGLPCMPKPTFSTFALSLASSVLVQLGEVPDPSTGSRQEDLVMAKHGIDTLAMLQKKIAEGLDAEEARLLKGLLYELRMKFVMKK